LGKRKKKREKEKTGSHRSGDQCSRVASNSRPLGILQERKEEGKKEDE